MSVIVKFKGGPYAGTSKVYAGYPKVGKRGRVIDYPLNVGCVTDATAKGMRGIYRVSLVEDVPIAKWVDVPK